MSANILDRLNSAIDKHEQGRYSEQDFHSTLESIIQAITESHLDELRLFLLNAEGSLERIDFMVNEEGRRSEYLKIIKQIKDYLNQKTGFTT